MSLYRYTIQNGAMIRQKRGFLRWWIWIFNRSEEDEVNRLKNELVLARSKVKNLARLIPKKHAMLEARKKELRAFMDSSGKHYGPSWRDKFSPRREAVRLIEEVKVAKKKEPNQHGPPKPAPVVLAQLTTAPPQRR
jgi:hypothetical protein